MSYRDVCHLANFFRSNSRFDIRRDSLETQSTCGDCESRGKTAFRDCVPNLHPRTVAE